MSTWVDTKPQDKVDRWIAANGDKACATYHTDDPHFALWLAYVDRATKRRTYMSFMDLEDWDYWSAYEGGMSPVEACKDMLAYNGYEEDEDEYV